MLSFTVVMPAMAEGMKKFQESMPMGNTGQPMPDMGGMFALQSSVGVLFGIFMACAWPVALVIMLNTKSAKEALAPGQGGGMKEEG